MGLDPGAHTFVAAAIDAAGAGGTVHVKGIVHVPLPEPAVCGDGLCDGPDDVTGVCEAGEDMDADGERDQLETDPRKADAIPSTKGAL